MRVQILSDLHFEFHKDRGEGFINSLDPEGVDVLVLAGDIGLTKQGSLKTRIRQFCAKYPEVIMVCGNHEFYGTHRKYALAALQRRDNELENFHFLENKAVEIKGQRFLGCTMWFADDPWVQFLRKDFNDFHCIKDFEKWVYRANELSGYFLRQSIQQGDVVVTHHAPSRMSVGKEFRGDKANCFYVYDMENTMGQREPAVWIHGHMHDSKHYEVYDTRVVCNPYGYQGKRLNPYFNSKKVIEV